MVAKKDWWSSGEWNALCDQCGMKRKSGQLQERWDGLMVCKPTIKIGCWEPRHPQELIRPIPDNYSVPWTRPEPADRFVSSDLDSGSISVSSGDTSATITDSSITASSLILIEGTVPADQKLVIGKVAPGSGSAIITFAIPPSGDLTLYYVIVG